MSDLEIRIVRSRRRKKTVEAKWIGDVLEVRAPADLADAELTPIIDQLRRRLEAQRKRRRPPKSDKELAARAEELNQKYFDGELEIRSIRYVSNQQRRFGSCTPSRGTIRLSDRLKAYPKWVLDYVIVHELAHLVHANHTAAFWELVNRYPLTERARGFLIAMNMADDTLEEPPT